MIFGNSKASKWPTAKNNGEKAILHLYAVNFDSIFILVSNEMVNTGNHTVTICSLSVSFVSQ